MTGAIGPGTRVLVTGGAAFIGSQLVEQLVATTDDVALIDNPSTGRVQNLQAVTGRIALDILACSDGVATSEGLPGELT